VHARNHDHAVSLSQTRTYLAYKETATMITSVSTF